MRAQFLGLVRKIFIPAIAVLFLTVNFSLAEQVARLSVHWSAKHHCAKHAQIFADRVNARAKGKLKIEFDNDDQDHKILNFADIYRTRTVQKRQNLVVYEISGTSERINKFLDDLTTISGIKVELVRSGPIGLGI